MLVVIAAGVVLSTLEPGRADVAGRRLRHGRGCPRRTRGRGGPGHDAHGDRRAADRHATAALLSIGAALVFGVGLVAAGKSAALVPVAWVALAARLVGIVVVVIPLVLQGRLPGHPVALPLVVIAGVGEVLGSMLSAWGSRDSIAITAVMGSQFAAIAAVAAYFLFGERLGRLQVAGVVLIVAGVTVLAAVTA